MARIRDIEKDEAPAKLQRLYDRVPAEVGPFLSQVKAFAHRPPILEHMMGMMLALAKEQCVPQRTLEIALVTVSKLNECRYCVAHHTPRLVDSGLGPETAARILESDCPGLDDFDRQVRDYAALVTSDSKRIPDSLVAGLRQRLDEAQLMELTFRTALCGFYNRFNEALRLDIEDGVIADMLACGGSLDDLPEA